MDSSFRFDIKLGKTRALGDKMISMETKIIDIGKDFSTLPGGRFKEDGPYTGEHFREKFLPCIRDNEKIIIKLDSTSGFGSSFLEEAFGGLVRKEGFKKEQLREKLKFETDDSSLEEEIWEYIDDAAPE
jgi:hypothetical protein